MTNMTPTLFNKIAINPAMTLLPPVMDSLEARAMLLAIGLQESRFQYRVQVKGPARGFTQFEKGGGIVGVLNHPATRNLISSVLDQLVYDKSPDTCYTAIQHNDILCVCFSRLLLWTVPDPLPKQGEFQQSWDQYIKAWRPGKPHRQTWDSFYREAWDTVKEAPY